VGGNVRCAHLPARGNVWTISDGLEMRIAMNDSLVSSPKFYSHVPPFRYRKSMDFRVWK
jgi:hypothetical protein